MKSLILLGSCICVFVPVFSQESAPFPPPPSDVSPVVTLVTADEPGERLIVDGIACSGDGRTPLPGFVLYLYQTDATGVYNKTDGNWQRPRIRGWVRTDSNGKYEIRTIKPGSYPGSRNPAHIHVIVKPSGKDPDWIDEFLFDGDPFRSPVSIIHFTISIFLTSTKCFDGSLNAMAWRR